MRFFCKVFFEKNSVLFWKKKHVNFEKHIFFFYEGLRKPSLFKKTIFWGIYISSHVLYCVSVLSQN